MNGVGGSHVGDQDGVCAGGHPRLEGIDFAGQHLLPGFLGGGPARLTVPAGAPLPGEVLQGTGHACLMEAVHRRADQHGGLLRVGAKRTVAQNRVVRVGFHIGHGGQIQVKTQVPEKAAQSQTGLLGLGRVSVRAHRGHIRHLGGGEGLLPGKGRAAAALFLDGKEGRDPGGLGETGHQRLQLVRVLELFRCADKTAHRVVF